QDGALRVQRTAALHPEGGPDGSSCPRRRPTRVSGTSASRRAPDMPGKCAPSRATPESESRFGSCLRPALTRECKRHSSPIGGSSAFTLSPTRERTMNARWTSVFALVVSMAASSPAAAEKGGDHRVVWDDFKDGFSVDAPDARWLHFAVGSAFVADD